MEIHKYLGNYSKHLKKKQKPQLSGAQMKWEWVQNSMFQSTLSLRNFNKDLKHLGVSDQPNM